MEKTLLEILVCPSCKGKLHYEKESLELICFFEQYAYPIRDNIPVMLVSETRLVSLEELETIKANKKVT